MWKCEESLSDAGIGPKSAVRSFAERYEDYVHAYYADSRTCGREKLLLSQAASYLDGVLGIKVEGIVVTLSLGLRKNLVIPAVSFYE